MTTRETPQCLTCLHYTPPTDDAAPMPDVFRCTVFPAAIPWPIWDNTADHRRPYEGDNGQRWTAAWPGAKFPERAFATDAAH
jgi:hypothetical protein